MDDDVRALTELNARFLGAYVAGSLEEPCVHGCLWPVPTES